MTKSTKSQIYDAILTIVIFGDARCRIDEITQSYWTNLFKSDSKKIIGVNFGVKGIEIDGKKIKLQIWDFGGEERFKFLLPTYAKGANGGIFLYDVANYSTLTHLDDWLTIIKKKVDKLFPIIVVGNNAASKDREVSSEDAIRITKSRGLDAFVECDANTGEKVEEMFETLTRLMLQKSKF